MTKKREKSFREELIIVVIDKLLIFSLVLIIGYFINRSLSKYEYENTKKTEEYKALLLREKMIYNNEFLLFRDSLEQKFLVKQKSYDNKQLEDRRRMERFYKERREEAIRLNEQHHNERLINLKNNKDIYLDKIKSTNSLNSLFLKKSVDKISEVWNHLNKIFVGSEIIQNKLVRPPKKRTE